MATQKKKNRRVRISLARTEWITILSALERASTARPPEGWSAAEWAMQCGAYAALRESLLRTIAADDVAKGGA